MDRLLLSRIAFCAAAAALLAVAVIRRRRTAALLHDFFGAAGHPLNLAVFRIVLFWTLLQVPRLEELRWFAQLPAEFRVYPWGARWWLLTAVPLNDAWVTGAWIGFQVACWLAVIGLWARPAAVLAAVIGMYVLGVPQFFGKVHHYHHLIWFAAILGVSRCADMLSVDALIAAWRRADQGRTEPSPPSPAYALPLRFVWLLMGLMYFFPGFWKWWTAGIDWAWSDNLKLHLYAKWAEYNSWVPSWRIDQYPLAYRLAGLGTILFELTFLWCMVFPRLRVGMAAGGLLFHQSTGAFMKISFTWLQACYVSFVNWARGLRWIGERLFPRPLDVAYDGNCTLCRRTVALLRTVDWLERIVYVNALDEAALRSHGLHTLDRQALVMDMHAVDGSQRWLGYDAYRAIAWRIPLLWPLLPVLYLPPVAALGKRIYRRVADHRTCRVPSAPAGSAAAAPAFRLRDAAGVIAVGAFLFVGNAFYGLRGLSSAWPLACYPTFRLMVAAPEQASLRIDVVEADGRSRPLDDRAFQRQASVGRWKNMVGSIMNTKDEAKRRERLRRLWELWAQADPALRSARAVRFYRVTRSTVPEHAGQTPLREELLWETTL